MATSLLDLGSGQPPHDLMPFELMRRATQHMFDTHADAPGSGPLHYGDDTQRYREAVAAFIGRRDKLAEAPSAARIVPTGGVSQGIDMALTVLGGGRGDCALVEDPCYFLAMQIFRDRGLSVRGVGTDAEGVTEEALRAAAAAAAADGLTPRFLYTVPTHNNPQGGTMPLARRRALAAACEELGVTILADEVYHQLGFAGAELPPPRFAALTESALSVCSFSKLVAPGLRVGWIEAAEAVAARFNSSGVVLSGGAVTQLSAYVVACALEDGLVDAHVDELQRIYGERGRALMEALDGALPAGVAHSRPQGGYFVWVTLPEGADTTELLALAEREHGVSFKAGELFSPDARHTNCLRLCFAKLEPEALREAAGRLGAAISAYLSSSRGGSGSGSGSGSS